MPTLSRRNFLAAASLTAAAGSSRALAALASKSPFHIAIISDEISEDFDHACSVIANDFGLGWAELRGIGGKNLQALSEDEIASARKTLARYNLRVTDIASPLFKVDWPGAPLSQYAEKRDQFGADANFKQQDTVLEHSIHLAKSFGTDKVRCFDFWRLDDPKPFRRAINDKLQQAAETAGKQGIILVLENEFACNTATGRESAETLAGIPSRNLALNWDPGNAVMRGELDAFSGGWDALPKDRIHHCHVKNAVKNDTGKIVWSPVDKGFVDWTAQFKALKQAGYRDAVSLETHWRGAGTPEASTRISWAGMKQCLESSHTA
jgi:sugar phosphate isomerase/epimerase